jgi:citrate lyase subunit beta / citryl-CoA lyase
MRELRPLRSLLFVPGGRADMIAKVGRSAPDGVVIDLEDAVPGAEKDGARRTTVAALETLDVPAGTLVLVRVNAGDSPWYADDVAAVAATRADGVVRPKTGSPQDLEGLRSALDTAGRPDAVVVAGLENALGVADARTTLAAAGTLGVIAVYFGAEDYIADLGGRRTAASTEVLYARSQVVLAARLAGIPALDQVVVGVRDDEGFLADAEVGRSLGYSGKLCIHPRQVPLAHRIFTPSAAEVAHARAVVDAVGGAGGVGAVLVDGEMVDDVHLRMAQAVLARVRAS